MGAVAIGRGTDLYRRFWKHGSLDEIRIDGTQRTSSWVCLSYLTQNPDTTAYYSKVALGSQVTNLRSVDKNGTFNVTGANGYSFSLPAGSAESAELRIVDVFGRTVYSSSVRLDGKAATVGWNGVGANGARVTSGVYFARLKTVNQGKIREFALRSALTH
jgi:hypothetical protein